MKKKFKDITIGEMVAECILHPRCEVCPFYRLNLDCECVVNSRNDELEIEVELTKETDEEKRIEEK